MFGMDMSTFELLVARREEGTPLNFGWGNYEYQCPHCLRVNRIVAIAGTISEFECCVCAFKETKYWMPANQETAHDGGWLDPIGWEVAKLIGRN